MDRTLYLDAASPVITVGLDDGRGGAITWLRYQDEAGVALFRAVDSVTRTRGIALGEIDRFVYCEGPGSLLGVRLVAMALRTWLALPRPTAAQVQGYRSLELVAVSLLAAGTAGPFHVIADGRRNSWNVQSVDPAGHLLPLRRRPAQEGAFPEGEPVFHPENFPLWQALPSGTRTVPYDVSALPALADRFSLLRTTTQPDAFMTELPTYREWTPEHPVRPT